MTRKLIRHGNSAAIILDKPILELLKLTMDTPLEISTDGLLTVLQDQITRYDGEFGIRDLGLFSSAIAVPQASLDGHGPASSSLTFLLVFRILRLVYG